ncbi:redox-sensing transcriptional repressor Rex, partial [Micromonospora sp. M51]
PEATVARLPEYLRALHNLADTGHETVSSEGLSAAAGVNSAKLRKDLSHLGSYGTRGVGYDVALLIEQIEYVLGLTQRRAVALVGVGNLGHALAGYDGFASRGFRIAALLDADPSRVGEEINGLVVRHVDDLPTVAAEESLA